MIFFFRAFLKRIIPIKKTENALNSPESAAPSWLKFITKGYRVAIYMTETKKLIINKYLGFPSAKIAGVIQYEILLIKDAITSRLKAV